LLSLHVFLPSLWPKMPKADVLIVPERPVVPTELVEVVELAPLDKNVLEELVSVTEVALVLSVDLTDVVPLVENV
jgi:hypothetical protein